MSATRRDPVRIAEWSELRDREPAHVLVENVDPVILRFDDEVAKFNFGDLTTFDHGMHRLTGIRYAGINY